MRSVIAIQQRSENGYGFQSPGLKMGVENGIFWSEIGSGFGDPGGTPLPRIPRSTPRGVGSIISPNKTKERISRSSLGRKKKMIK